MRIDRIVGKTVAYLKITRSVEFDRAAKAADLSFDDIIKIMTGDRRLRAIELHVLSKELSIPVSAFFAGLGSECSEGRTV